MDDKTDHKPSKAIVAIHRIESNDHYTRANDSLQHELYFHVSESTAQGAPQ